MEKVAEPDAAALCPIRHEDARSGQAQTLCASAHLCLRCSGVPGVLPVHQHHRHVHAHPWRSVYAGSWPNNQLCWSTEHMHSRLRCTDHNFLLSCSSWTTSQRCAVLCCISPASADPSCRLTSPWPAAGASVIHALTGVNIYAAAFFIPVGVSFYTAQVCAFPLTLACRAACMPPSFPPDHTLHMPVPTQPNTCLTNPRAGRPARHLPRLLVTRGGHLHCAAGVHAHHLRLPPPAWLPRGHVRAAAHDRAQVPGACPFESSLVLLLSCSWTCGYGCRHALGVRMLAKVSGILDMLKCLQHTIIPLPQPLPCPDVACCVLYDRRRWSTTQEAHTSRCPLAQG